jgi:prepilin peptidase CpaA
MSAQWIHLAPLLAMLVIAAVIDARQRRIPNWLTAAMMLCGLAQSFTSVHSVGPGAASLGLLAGLALMLGQFALGGLGGGDVKLLMGVGSWVGPLPLLMIFMAASVAGLIIVLVQAWWQGRLASLVRNSSVIAVNLIHLREIGVEHVSATGASCRSIDKPLPYAVVVLIGTVAIAAGPWLLRG